MPMVNQQVQPVRLGYFMRRLLILPLLLGLSSPAYSERGYTKTFLGCYGDFCQEKVRLDEPSASGKIIELIEIYDCVNVRSRNVKKFYKKETPEWNDVIMGTVGFTDFKEACDKREKK